MSIAASIDITLSKNLGNTDSVRIIEALLDYGWSIENEGFVSYLPYGDKEDFEWVLEKISRHVFFNEIAKKERAGELIGVVLFWGASGIGGDLLIQKNGVVSFAASINRVELRGSSITDASWYIERLLFAFTARDFAIESYVFSHHF